MRSGRRGAFATSARGAPTSIWRSIAAVAAYGLGTWRAAASPWSTSMFEMLDLTERPSQLALAGPAGLCILTMSPWRRSRGSPPSGAASASTSSFACGRRTGDWVWLRKRADLVEDEETGGGGLVGIAFDVTERKREAELSATADQRLREAIEAISEAFVLWDSSNRLVLCNSKYQRCTICPARQRRPVPRRAAHCRAGSRRSLTATRRHGRRGAARRRIAHLRGAARRRALAAGQRAAHPRRRLCVGRHRHHRAQGA